MPDTAKALTDAARAIRKAIEIQTNERLSTSAKDLTPIDGKP